MFLFFLLCCPIRKWTSYVIFGRKSTSFIVNSGSEIAKFWSVEENRGFQPGQIVCYDILRKLHSETLNELRQEYHHSNQKNLQWNSTYIPPKYIPFLSQEKIFSRSPLFAILQNRSNEGLLMEARCKMASFLILL